MSTDEEVHNKIEPLDEESKATTFSERSPENLEKYIELVEELQQADVTTSAAETRGGAEERALNETNAYFSSLIQSEESTFESKVNFSLNKKQTDFVENSPLNFSKDSNRARTSNRLKYEAEVEVIKRQLGDLETVRTKLGLSRRKMCQLLMVDPSAWTRWTKEGAPPYVYRALEWYMLLSKEAPHQGHSYWLAAVGARGYDSSEKHLLNRLKSENEILEEKLGQMHSLLSSMKEDANSLRKRSRIQTFAVIVAILMGTSSFILYLYSIFS